MIESRYFWDTYAIIEVVKGNKNFTKYAREQGITSEFNLMETYYHLLRLFDEPSANKHVLEWVFYSRPIPYELMKQAMKFKLDNKNNRLSYVDCMGYAFALAHGMRFLTGNKSFYGMPNVEFVR